MLTGQETKPGESFLPTPDRIEKFVGIPTDYQPKTTLGKYLKTAAEFVPGAVIPAGEAGLLARLIKFGLVPGTVSEYAGERFKGTSLEGTARLAGALLGTGGMVALGREAGRAAMTLDELDTHTDALFRQLDNSGIQIKPNSFLQTATDMVAALKKNGLNPLNREHQPAYADMKAILQVAARAANRQAPLTFGELMQIRRMANLTGKSNSPQVRYFGHIMKEQIDDYMDRLTPSDIVGGRDAKQTVAMLKGANRMYSQLKKGQIIEDLMHRAEIGSQRIGIQAAIENEFRSLAKNKKLMRQFSPDEKKAIEAVVKDSSMEHVLRLVGKLAIRGQVSLMGTALTLGPIGAGVGEVAKVLSRKVTQGKAANAFEVAKGGKPASYPVPLQAAAGPAGGLLAPDYRDPNTGLWYGLKGDTEHLLEPQPQ